MIPCVVGNRSRRASVSGRSVTRPTAAVNTSQRPFQNMRLKIFGEKLKQPIDVEFSDRIARIASQRKIEFKGIKKFILTPRLSGIDTLNDATLIFQNWLVFIVR